MASFHPSGGPTGTSTHPVQPRTSAERSAYNPEMIFVGQACHLDECHREDFLPLRCPYCTQSFCSEHSTPHSHRCPKYDSIAASQDYRVPLCPLCHQPPSSWRRDQDPNISLDLHLSPRKDGSIECQELHINGLRKAGEGTTGGKRVKREGECREKRCRKMMVVPIQCPSCKQNFCPSHRTPQSHACASSASSSSQTASSKATGSQSSSSAAGLAAAGAAFKRLANSATPPSASGSSSSSPSTKPPSGSASKSKAESSNNASSSGGLGAKLSNLNIGTSKVDRRANSESQSQLKALQERNKRGLLSEREKVLLAEEMARRKGDFESAGRKRGQGKDGDKECVIV